VALDLEGYRWVNDDGSESAASFAENQDTPATFALDTPKRLRCLVNAATADPPNAKYRLEYKKSTDSQWLGVPPEGTPGHAVTLALSSNIAAGGANTTARLAAPAGKDTGDFQTGRIWDDENGDEELDFVDETKYTELEWCVQAVSGVAAASDVYQFRVTLESAAGADVAHDNHAVGSWVTTGGTTAQVAITVGSGANRALYVGAAWVDTAAGNSSVSGVSSSVDGAFAHVTNANILIDVGGVLDEGLDWWVLVNPTAGAHTCTVTWSEAVIDRIAIAASFENVNQTTPFANADTDDLGQDPTSPMDDTLTTADGDAVMSMLVYGETVNRVNLTAGTEIADTLDASNEGLGIVAGYMLSDSASETIQYTKIATIGYVAVSGFSIPKA
jgi:hypothetical protein